MSLFFKDENAEDSELAEANYSGSIGERIDIDDEFSIYLASKKVREAGKRCGLNKTQLEEVEIALRELVSNVMKYGGGRGMLHIFDPEITMDALILEIQDWGEGINDLHKALEDGYTTGSSMGGGLPAVNRLMDSFEYISQSKRGAKLRISKKAHGQMEKFQPWRFGVYSRPFIGEVENGDGFFLKNSDDIIVAAVVDGLGHGVEAFKATKITLRIIEDYYRWPEEELIKILHEKLHGTRGVALGFLRTKPNSDTVNYTGIGNVFGHLINTNITTFVNYNGTLGIKLRKFRSYEYPYKKGDIIVMHSDGISIRWLDDFKQIWSGDLQGFSHHVIKKYSRANDDASIIAGGQL
ncbi:ATP-binding protein [bacterium]|nr:ATP-binding protein [FCB group bacterium]MBL7191795.1 ATP-binding protein [bacterium]